jgi:iduronate 2-sulfatase
MHALANGEIRTVSAEMDVYQSVEGTDKTYPDGWITELALSELKQLKSSEKPFLLAVGFIRPHLPFGAPENYLEPYRELSLPPIPHPEIPPETSTWHPSKEFMQYNRWDRDPRSDPQFAIEVRRHYAACVSYIDTQIGSILQQLKALGLDKNTTIVLWGDHGWHLGEHAIWGKHALFEESLHSPLIIQTPQLPSQGVPTEAIVESIDIYPTLCELAGIPSPGHLNGQSLKPHLENPESGGHVAVGYNHGASTIRSDTHRLILHHSGKTELYDHSSTERETENIAESNPQLVAQLLSQLKSRRPEK